MQFMLRAKAYIKERVIISIVAGQVIIKINLD